MNVMGHVEMDTWLYQSMTKEERMETWGALIARVNPQGKACLFIPYTDEFRMVTGMNLVSVA